MKPEEIIQTARHAALRKLCSYLEGDQYEGRPDWWSGKNAQGQVVPLRERAPCIVYPLPKAATNQLTRFTFGVDKWPSLDVTDERVPEAQQADASATIDALVEQCGIKPAIRALMSKALAVGTAVVIVGVRRGALAYDMPRAQDCLPTFEDDDPGAKVLSLTWCYQFNKTVDGDNGPEVRRHWFRRDVDAVHVTQFFDAPVVHNEEPAWKVDPTRTIAHGLGFCPVLWMRNMPDGEHGDIDGASIYDGLLDEFDALNFALSQRHRGIHYFGTPQPYETGVDSDDGPEAAGRTASDIPGFSSSHVPAGRQPFGATERKARRMAPDYMWSYRSPDAKVGLVETTGKAFEVTSLHVEDIRSRILESMGVVLINQQQVLGSGGGGKEMSGRFLRLAFGPMLNLVDELRESCWWPHLRDLIATVLRIVTTLGPAQVNAPCVASAAALGGLLLSGAPIAMTPLWGDSFELSAEEAKASAEAATAAKDGKLISKETAARYVSGPFGVADIEAECEAIEREAEEAQEAAMAATQAIMSAHEGDGDDEAPKPPVAGLPATPTKPPQGKERE